MTHPQIPEISGISGMVVVLCLTWMNMVIKNTPGFAKGKSGGFVLV